MLGKWTRLAGSNKNHVFIVNYVVITILNTCLKQTASLLLFVIHQHLFMLMLLILGSSNLKSALYLLLQFACKSMYKICLNLHKNNFSGPSQEYDIPIQVLSWYLLDVPKILPYCHSHLCLRTIQHAAKQEISFLFKGKW